MDPYYRHVGNFDPPQHRIFYGKSTKPQRNDPLSHTQTADVAHRSLQHYKGREISKVAKCLLPAWFPSIAALTWRTGFVTKSIVRIFRRHRRFATVVLTDSTPLPLRRSALPSERSFKSSNMANLSSTRRRCYFSLRL